MFNLAAFADALDVLPIVLMPALFFVVIVAVIIAAVIKRAKAEQRRQEMESQTRYPFTDGNGRTAHQSEYLAAKRRELAERNVTAKDNTHSHSGSKETYDKIVGSLGEVNDEGCDELDGIRLIEHDEAYCDDPDHILSSDPTDLERAIVLGEVINTPRYKQSYRRK